MKQRTSKRAPMKRTTRGYSRDFTPRNGDGVDYRIGRIPSGLWTRVKRKAKRDGVSVRATILTYLREWASE